MKWCEWQQRDLVITALDSCFRVKTPQFMYTLNTPIRQCEDETFLLIWIQHSFWFYHLLVQTEAWWLFVVFICFMLFLCVNWNHFNSMSILQVTTVFATKLKSFTFVPLLKRLPAENRVWKKVLKASRPNKVRTTLETAQYGYCYVYHTVSLKNMRKNITVQGTG